VTRTLPLLSLLLSLSLLPPADAGEAKGGPPELKGLKFRLLGPAAGGRVCRACGVPGDPLTYYAATAGGGVWKSADGGLTWKPIFDDQPTSTIGSIAVSPSDPNVIYAGSGEANIRGNVQPGNGIYRSTDAGKTWKHVWKQVGQIGTMVVHPSNPDVAYAAVLGHAFGPNEERGVFRTTDGGKTWVRVLFRDRDSGASDVCFDPHNPRVLFAGLWQARRYPWDLVSGGPGSGLFTTTDGGDTWTELVAPPAKGSPDHGKDAPAGKKYCEGLPEGPWGKVCVAVAPSNRQRVYAMIEAEKGGFFRSDDGGDSWEKVNDSRALRQRAWYFSTFAVHPRNADVVFFPQVPLLKTTDGGKTLQRVKGPHHGDHHDVWIDPKMPERMIDSNDGGVDVSLNGGASWFAPPLPIGQFYHIACDSQVPYHVMGTMQDIGTGSGPSNSLEGGGVRLGLWLTVGGGETGFCAPDPADPDVIFAGEYGGYLSRFDRRTRQVKSIGIYPYNPSGHGAEDLRYRFQWTAPVMVSKHDRALYHAANVVFRSRDEGKTWEKVSPDLTRDDKSKQKWAGGPITGDNTGVEVYCTVYALAESPAQKGLLWAGSDDGLVHVSREAGKWDKVTPKEMPEWATVRCIEPSAFDAGTAWVVADAHRLDDYRPYLFRTTDGGKTWKKLGANLPQDVFLRVVREDPKVKGLLYLGTERGLAFSRDGGDTWTELKLNLPTAAVSDLVVKDDDLVVGTSGRSIWVFDDLTPLRRWSPKVAEAKATLLPPRPAVRYRMASALEPELQPGSGDNPPEGAVLHYHLKAAPKGDLTLEILDGKDEKVVRTLSSKEEPAEDDGDIGAYSDREKKKPLPSTPGLHRVVWDLRYEGARRIKGAKLDGGNPKEGPLALPGKYVVVLTVDGEKYRAELEVRPDPRVKLPAEELATQLEFALKLRDDISRLSDAVEQLRSVRGQIQARDKLLEAEKKAETLRTADKAVLAKLDALEEKLHNPKAKTSYDILAIKGGAQLYSQLAWLFELAKDADGAPNQGLREVYEEQDRLLMKLLGDWQALLSGDLAKLNEDAKKADVPGVLLPAAKTGMP
jgi:photosystem II stability/assembly factor-like uncharacterized protein